MRFPPFLGGETRKSSKNNFRKKVRFQIDFVCRGFWFFYCTVRENETLKKHVLVLDFFADFYENQKMFTNRGGAIGLDEKNNKKPPVNCSYATYPVINSLGDLILCCQDFHNNYVFGNIMEKPLKEIWFDEKNIKLRKRIYDYKLDLKICKNCKM